ncbi:DUF6894 family protein [Lichenibacterium minor]|uniref:DUF6894 family protein n=1 Tax=Lichenibacterium minor TaxID=2316528 RepID=UPI003D16D7EE
MPRFHFNILDGANSPDRDGSDVVDFDDARRQAIHMAGVILQDQGLGHSPISPLRVDVADVNGNILLSVQVALTYRSRPEGGFGRNLISSLT